MVSINKRNRILKRIFLCVSVFFAPVVIVGQTFRPQTDFGVFGGVSYYLGDINPRGQFYDPSLSVGALLKHNFTEHHVLRANIFYGTIKGDDLDFGNDFQQMRGNNFSTSILSFQLGYEFGFLPYIINRWKTAHTPYIFAGIAGSLIVSSSTEFNNHFVIPFGIGYKYRITPQIGIGCEWSINKSFSDTLDGVTNPSPDGSYSKLHNNDWYSFVGVYITFRIFEKGFECPAYRKQVLYQ